MSTRLLTRLESRHTITDDLESHYFVLMWTALHWVKHNRSGCHPCVDMEYIFDYQRQLANGTVKGGAGKVEMYRSRGSELHEVEFACEPFNKLFWDMWTLFAGYFLKRWDASLEEDSGPGKYLYRSQTLKVLNFDVNSEPSVSPQEVIGLFENAVKQPEWIDDKVADQFPRAGSKDASGNPLLDLSNRGDRFDPNQGKKRMLSKSFGVCLDQLPAKRPKES